MTISFKPIVLPGGRRKDGTWPVYVRITFKGKSRRIPTAISARQEDLTRSQRLKSPDLLNAADKVILPMKEAVRGLSPFDLEDHDVDWVVDHIRRTLHGAEFRLDFFEFAEEVIRGKASSTRAGYATALNALERFLGCRQLDVNDITKAMLLEFQEKDASEPKMHWSKSAGRLVESGKQKRQGAAIASLHVAKLAKIFNAAKAKYNDEDAGRIVIPRSPFSTLPRVHFRSQGQRPLDRDLLQRMIDARPESDATARALAVFVVSFGLMAPNMADLYEARKPRGGKWEYNRRKTRDRRADHARMLVAVPEEIRWHAALLEGPGPWWFPVLHNWRDKDIATQKVNYQLKRWCESEGVEPFTFGAARHSWATLALGAAGVEKAVVDESLAHVGDFPITDIYAERSWSRLEEANKKVLALFRWPSGRDAGGVLAEE